MRKRFVRRGSREYAPAMMTNVPSRFRDDHRVEEQDDELERSPLVQRLRSLDWPEAPADVKQRVLDRIMAEHPGLRDGGA